MVPRTDIVHARSRVYLESAQQRRSERSRCAPSVWIQTSSLSSLTLMDLHALTAVDDSICVLFAQGKNACFAVTC